MGKFKSALGNIRKGITRLPDYIIGRLHFVFHYDKKYLSSKWFKGKGGGVGAVGWKWARSDWQNCKKLNVNPGVRWPVSPRVEVLCPENIIFDPDDLNNFQTFGVYYQANGTIEIGKGTFIGPNVGLITRNHDIHDPEKHAEAKPIKLGEACWIGMNSMILPGVELGPHTVVGAGAVVTKSFPEGYCVIAGNPARKIKEIQETESEV